MLSKLSSLQEQEKWKIVFTSGTTSLYSFSFEGEKKAIYTEKDSFIGQPSVSNDGKVIIFPIEKIGERDADIMVINSDGTDVYKLFSYPFAKGISLSPNGEIIAFWGDFDENKKSKNLYLYDFKVNKVKLLQKDATYSETAFAPSWSPDSRKLAYASLDGYIAIADIDDMSIKKVIKGDAPSWSPDGKTIIYREGYSYFKVLQDNKTTEYYIEGHKYYSVNPEGKNKKFIFDGSARIWESGGDTYAPVVWSPDSKYILFFRPYDSLTKGPNRSKIYVMDIKEGTQFFVKKQAGLPSFAWANLKNKK